MGHFYANPISHLATLYNLKQPLKQLTNDHAEWIRMQPSFRRHVESIYDMPEEIRLLLTDDNHLLRVRLPEWIQQQRTHRENFTKALRIFLALQKYIPPKPIHQQPIRMLHLFALRGDLFDTEFVQASCLAARYANSYQLRDLLNEILSIYSHDQDHHLYQIFEQYLAQLDTLEATLSDESDEEEQTGFRRKRQLQCALQSTTRRAQSVRAGKGLEVAIDASETVATFTRLTQSVIDQIEEIFR
jgi:hypothetical protein